MRKHTLSTTDNREIKINFGTSILGRNPDNTISLPEPSLSSRHALIANYDQYIEIMDLQSSNGTFVNNKRIMPFFPVRLYSGDKLSMGKLSLQYQSEEDNREKVNNTTTTLNTSTSYLDSLSNMKGDVTVFAKFDPKRFLHSEDELSKDNSQKLQEYNKRLSFLYSFGQKIGSIFELKALFKNILSEIFDLFTEADRALIFLNKDGEMAPEIFIKNGQELPLEQANYSKTIVNMAVNEKHGFIASDMGTSMSELVSQSILALNLQCTMIVPFIVENEIYGLLQLDSTKKINAFTEEDLRMLSGISNQVAVNIKNQILMKSIQEQEKVKNSLERYLGPKMVTHLIDNKINLEHKGEERLVSIMWSDIRGFTPMSEKLTPKEVIEVLTIYFSKMTEVIFKYDGFIDKFIGDAIFCIFGIPLYQDNHADLAVKAAQDMQRAIKELNKQLLIERGIELNVGIGINTGNVVYGNIASMERPEVTILGDNVNVTERLCSQAKGGQIFISEKTIGYLKDSYNKEPIGELSLKGKQEKIMTYNVSI